jgi:intraflagellar transport protein 172
MAFVYLNRYLDIVEAIDDQDASTIDNVNFETSDIPQDFPVPESHFLEGTILL